MANYIMDLRKEVGSRPLIMCAAGVFIINEKNQVLLEQRADNNKWTVTGGAIELGESLEEAVRRETKEELGVELGKLELFNIYSGEDEHFTYSNGDEVYAVVAVYITREFTREMLLDYSEVKDIKFFNINEIPQNIHKPYIVAIKELQNLYINNKI